MALRTRANLNLKAHLAAQFETALLISGDLSGAEDALLTTIAETDLPNFQSQPSLKKWRHDLVLRSIVTSASYSSTSRARAEAAMLPALRPVLSMDSPLRICFVLRLLLGYSTADCAGLLRPPEDEVGRILSNALVQLREISGLSTQTQKESSCQTEATST